MFFDAIVSNPGVFVDAYFDLWDFIQIIKGVI